MPTFEQAENASRVVASVVGDCDAVVSVESSLHRGEPAVVVTARKQITVPELPYELADVLVVQRVE